MTRDEQRQVREGASKGSIIDSIGIAVERFNRALTDVQKTIMFQMNIPKLEKIRRDTERAKNGIAVSQIIAAAIATATKERMA